MCENFFHRKWKILTKKRQQSRRINFAVIVCNTFTLSFSVFQYRSVNPIKKNHQKIWTKIHSIEKCLISLELFSRDE